MKYKILLLAIGLLTITSIKAQRKVINKKNLMEKIKQRNKESVLTLKYGENIFDENHDLNITFKKVVDDERCPENKTCKLIGWGTVEIELMSVHSRPQRFQLSTIDKNEKYPRMIVFGDYEISLEALLPKKKSYKKIKEEDYSIVLKIKKHALRSDFQEKINFEEFPKKNLQKGKSKLLENYSPATSEFRIHPAESKTD